MAAAMRVDVDDEAVGTIGGRKGADRVTGMVKADVVVIVVVKHVTSNAITSVGVVCNMVLFVLGILLIPIELQCVGFDFLS